MPDRGRRTDRWFLAGAFLLALGVRLLPIAAAREGGLRLLSSDSYGHLRRSAMTARAFPSVPIRDVWLNPPEGGVWIWPPAFDLLVGGVARLAFGSAPTVEDTTRVAAAIPPLLGALHVLPLFALARRALSRPRARLAVAAYAVLPAAALWSCYGHADHHVLEALALLAFLAAAARAASPEPSDARRLGRAALAGLLLAGTLLVWQGAVAIAALAALWALVALPGTGAVLGAVAAASLALATGLALGGTPVPFSFVNFGWFQPVFLTAASVPLAVAAAIRRGRPGPRAGAALLALLLGAAVAPHLRPFLGAALRGGGYAFAPRAGAAGAPDDVADGGYLSYPPDLLSLITEARPLFAGGPSTIRFALEELSPGLLALPVVAALWALRAVRGRARGRAAAAGALALFGSAYLVLTLLQRRNVYYLAPFVALALADAIARVAGPRRASGRRGPVFAAALVGIVGAPAIVRVASYAGAPGPDFTSLLRRLRALDPPPVEAGARPQPAGGRVASVMGPWSAGHLVTALTGRPAAADPFAYGWRRQCRLFSTPDAGEAERILRESRSRYLLVADLSRVLPAYAAAAGRADGRVADMFAERVFRSRAASPLPFLTRVLDSETGSRAPDGSFQPAFSVFRVAGVEDRAPP